MKSQNNIHGNAVFCNKCKKILYPKDRIKIKSYKVPEGSREEVYDMHECIDLCEDCYISLKLYLQNKI